MPAVSQKIPNLLGGVSQQPDPVKLPGQVRVAENVYLDPTFGCRKRPSTQHIARLASDVPSFAKWFPIFRDSNERYAVAIYQLDASSDPVCRVWDLNDGSENTVTISDFSKEYLRDTVKEDISQLTVADYTLISNRKSIVSMSGETSDVQAEEAFVVINQVSYNTTYSIDLLEADTELEQVKIYTATGVEVIPGSWVIHDGGACSNQEVVPFNFSAVGKSGLTGDVTKQCTPIKPGEGYDSRYTASARLTNGGIGFRTGDQFYLQTAGKGVTVRVTSDAFTYAYQSIGTANYTSSADSQAGQLSVTDITAGLANAVNALSGFEAEIVGNVIRIVSTNNEPFNLAVRGGSTNRAMTGIKGQASDVAELPTQGWDGTILKVNNTEDSDSDDYYVKFTTQSNGIPGAGFWQECAAPGIITTLNSSTMPQALIRNPDASFSLEPLNSDSAFEGWGIREVGDETSNPTPSFVGKGISDMFFYANRMGVLSEDSVVLSQPGDYFNYFVQSALTVSDADPIDLTASSTKPAFLKGAVGSPKGLILFAETSQFLLSTSEVAFAASTVKMSEVSNYYYKSEAPLLNTGVSVVFLSESATYAKAMEMAIDSVENRPEVADITKNVPEFLPSNMVWGESLPNNSMTVFGDNSSNIYVFKFFNNGGERQLAGWTTWTYPTDVVMFGSEDDLCHIVMFDGVNHTLVRSELTDDPEDAPLDAGFSRFTPRLDMYVPGSEVTKSVISNKVTRLTVPEDLRIDGVTYNVVVTADVYSGYFERPEVIKDDSGWYVDVPTDVASVDFVLGIQYNTSVELPAIFVTKEGKADRRNPPQVSNLYLELYYSGRYEITVNKLGYDPVSFTADTPNANIYLANDTPIDEISIQPIPIFCRGNVVRVLITCPDPFPSAITGYSWEGTYHTRGIRAI